MRTLHDLGIDQADYLEPGLDWEALSGQQILWSYQRETTLIYTLHHGAVVIVDGEYISVHRDLQTAIRAEPKIDPFDHRPRNQETPTLTDRAIERIQRDLRLKATYAVLANGTEEDVDCRRAVLSECWIVERGMDVEELEGMGLLLDLRPDR